MTLLETMDREELGKLVRQIWIDFCAEIGDTKPSHIAQWDDLSENDKEVDRRIGEQVYNLGFMNSEKKVETVIKKKIGNSMLYNADCRKIIPLMEDNSVDLLLTDPSYSDSTKTKSKSGNRYSQYDNQSLFDDLSERVFRKFILSILQEIYPKLKMGAHVYIFTGNKNLSNIQEICEMAGYKFNKWLVWNKESLKGGFLWRNQIEFILFVSKGLARNVNDLSLSNLLSYSTVSPNERSHPYQKPEGLIKDIIKNTTDENDTVVDIFAGSGTTSLVCVKNKRKSISCELSSEYFDIMVKRVKKGLDYVENQSLIEDFT